MTDRMTNAEIEAICGGLEAVLASPAGRDMCFVRDALTAIRQLQNPWMPIETAPRDGSNILILAHGMAIEALYSPGGWSADTPEAPAEYDCSAWVCFDDAEAFEIEETPHGDFHGPVTHWMPLPPAPEMGA